MRLIIEVHHTVKLDPSLMEFLKTVFPNQAALDALEKEIKDKTAALKNVVQTDTQPT